MTAETTDPARTDQARTDPAWTDAGRGGDQRRIESRAVHLLPEEAAAGSDDPRAQAAAILADADRREANQRAAPDTVRERRTSAENVEAPEPPD